MNKILSPKQYVIYFLSIFAIYIAYNLIVWNLFTSKFFTLTDNTYIGDLGRMSYQINLLHSRELKYTLKKSHLHRDNYKNQKIDIITLGDSFSRGGGIGENPYYQDFLATNFNANVLNLIPYPKENALETVIGLYNNGYLAKTKPKMIIVESAVREAPLRYAKQLNFDIKKVVAAPQEKLFEIKYYSTNMINTANFKFPYYTFLYHFKENASKAVYRLPLTKSLFSIGDGKTLLFYYNDLRYLPNFTPQNIKQINDNFNKVARMLKKLNIKLFFLPAPDKYDLYSDFIKDNKYPKNPFFDLIRPLKKDYYFVDTKKILLPLLQKGVKDVYWVDDTHWTQKASKAVTSAKIFTDNYK
jgi:hypothetical protein